MVAEFDPEKAGLEYLFLAFADYLAARFDDGTLPPGARLPGERDLASEHGVSIGTVRRATEVLRERGLVVTLPAKGTYVIRSAGQGDDSRRSRAEWQGQGGDVGRGGDD
ncbi:GntR family transcriptional regulator [Actinobacteria bacterium YIM 96077]|uniref:GntR family transcriptional regulator n=1 Tax=Phytoactinopolyspora halophila TaxID=1981511 RepID=A0A329QM04_9ACTN|nr:GntR family transcriptional regulator [Actinobacteria bacterium YIM 96077]RAW13273.1 GntR family transcriptional regulator [Phytoactinopolyspora halophila]